MSNCKVVPTGVKITLRDSNVALYIQNLLEEDLIVIKTDDPSFLTQSERHDEEISDFLLHSTRNAWLAELKDNVADFDKACDQISSTLDIIHSSEKHQALLQGKLIRAFVVSPGSRVPNITNDHIKKVCGKLKVRSTGINKPKNPLEYLQSVRCVPRVNGTPSQEGPVVHNAPSYPLYINGN